MAEMTIRMVVDPETGKKNITIAYASDADALPMEHEDEHRRLVAALLESGAVSAHEIGEIIVERETENIREHDRGASDCVAENSGLANET